MRLFTSGPKPAERVAMYISVMSAPGLAQAVADAVVTGEVGRGLAGAIM